MKILIPGSFDPPTNGHIDVITRCLKVFDEVLVGVIVNPSKESLFSTETRTEMLWNIPALVTLIIDSIIINANSKH